MVSSVSPSGPSAWVASSPRVTPGVGLAVPFAVAGWWAAVTRWHSAAYPAPLLCPLARAMMRPAVRSGSGLPPGPGTGCGFEDGQVHPEDGVDAVGDAGLEVLDASVESVAVGDCQGVGSVGERRCYQVLGPGDAVVCAEGGGHVQVGEAHAPPPCRGMLGAGPSFGGAMMVPASPCVPAGAPVLPVGRLLRAVPWCGVSRGRWFRVLPGRGDQIILLERVF